MPQVVEFRNALLCYHKFFNKANFILTLEWF